MARRSYRSRNGVTVMTLLLLVLTVALGPAPSSAAGDDWWNPAARPAPDSQINVTGAPFTGADARGQVRGFVDAHNHLFSNEAFGGRLICGRTFSEGRHRRRPRGLPRALPRRLPGDLRLHHQRR
ncbi:Coagulation factor 5/8 type domain-containing protein OS=Streptomyces glaucescens OX=1907 GN=SGLAU_03390 PE=4 SV=1 [Streptomyces glaucescens]